MQENLNSSFDIHCDPSKRIKFILIGLLLILNVIIRIPSIPHEKGYDSFSIHLLANSLSTFGVARWWINWLSVFGLYPNSYASAVPFTLSGISQLTGIEMEKTILLFCVFMGLFGIFTIYVFAKNIHNNFIYKYIMSLFFSLAPGLMIFTTWEVSTRGQFLVFLPLFVFLLLEEKFGIRKYILIFLVVLFIFSTHHYAFFLVPICAIYLALKVLQKMMLSIFENQYINYILIIVLIIASMYPFFTGMFIESGSRYIWVLDAMKTNLRQIGPLAIFLPAGILYLFVNRKNFGELLMCLTLILLAPIYYSQIYGPFILLFICIFLISISFNNLLRVIINYQDKLMTIFVILMVIFFVAFSSFYNHNRTGQSDAFWYMEDSTYAAGIWAKNYIPENSYGLDTGFETKRFFAVSEGHPITIADDFINLAYGLIKESNIAVANNSVMSSSYYFDGPYYQTNHEYLGQIEWLRNYGSERDLKTYDFFIVDKYDLKHIFRSVESKSSVICDGPRIQVWKNLNKGSIV